MTYTPTWRGPMEGYATNQVQRNLWRVRRTHDRDDLMQEARIVFLRCERAYPSLDEPRHFMALYKTALRRRFDELANRASRTPTSCTVDEVDGRDDPHDPVGDTENAGVLRVKVRQAPREVVLVLRLFLEAPAELLALAEGSIRSNMPSQAELNAMLRRLLGPSVGNDPIGLVRSYFVDAE